MKIGLHSPLPPAPTGVADYAVSLADALRRHAEIAFEPDGDADVDLYHLGNNQLHREIYRRALARPGVVVLHDAVMQHFYLGALDEPAYIAEFIHNYGEWHRDLARDLWLERRRSAQDPRYFEYPMLRRIGEAARAVIVHNPAAAARVRRHAPSARIVEIPHLFAHPARPREYEVLRLRQRLGLAPGSFLFGVFGHLRESKRLAAILKVFSRVRAERPKSALLVAGEFASSDLARSVALLAAQPGVIRTGYLVERDFWLHASAVDACINLRYPSAGETSGIAIRLMGIAKTLLVTDGPEVERFPEAACLRVDGGRAEEEMLEAYMLWLLETPGAAARIGRLAAEHIAAHHSVELVARRYLEVLS